METLATKGLIDHIVNALSITLIHSLWEGIVLSVVVGLIVILTRRVSATHRYNLLTGALFSFFIVVIFTFLYSLNNLQGYNISTHTQHSKGVLPDEIDYLLGFVFNYIIRYSYLLVQIWLLIICARSLHLLFDLYNIKQLKTHKIFSSGTYWEDRLKEFATKIGVSRPVKLLQSGIAKVPMVIGHLKPVILIPIGLVTALSQEEVEAILLHELAHIYRKDYLVNLLQYLMEIIFFFNPPVLWLSALIREERENCCDDIVISQTNDKKNYIQALIRCQEYQTLVPEFAMALGREKGQLVDRVKRILSNHNQTLNNIEKTILILCMAVTLLFTVSISNNSLNKTFAFQKEYNKHNAVSEEIKLDKPVKSDKINKQSKNVNEIIMSQANNQSLNDEELQQKALNDKKAAEKIALKKLQKQNH